MPRPKQRTPALREHILETACEVLAADGTPGLTARHVASTAGTSVPAVYELFGDKAGLVRELFFEGFRRLHARFDAVPETDDVREDLLAAFDAFRNFARENASLFRVMYASPFDVFDPGPEERRVGRATRTFLVRRVERCIEAGIIAGAATDIAHVVLGLAQGLATQETGGWLGGSNAERKRRWRLGAEALIEGLAPGRTALAAR